MNPAGEFILLIALNFLFCLAVCPNVTTLNEISGVIKLPRHAAGKSQQVKENALSSTLKVLTMTIAKLAYVII